MWEWFWGVRFLDALTGIFLDSMAYIYIYILIMGQEAEEL